MLQHLNLEKWSTWNWSVLPLMSREDDIYWSLHIQKPHYFNFQISHKSCSFIVNILEERPIICWCSQYFIQLWFICKPLFFFFFFYLNTCVKSKTACNKEYLVELRKTCETIIEWQRLKYHASKLFCLGWNINQKSRTKHG